jgi:hypothetical protein
MNPSSLIRGIAFVGRDLIRGRLQALFMILFGVFIVQFLKLKKKPRI